MDIDLPIIDWIKLTTILGPQLVLLVGALGVLGAHSLLRDKIPLLYPLISGVAAMGALITAIGGWNLEASELWVMIARDKFSLFATVLLLMVCALVTLLSPNYLKENGVEHGEYYCLLLFSTYGMILMCSATDLIIIFLGLELLSVGAYVLAGFLRTSLRSNESSLKYFLLGAFGTGFLLYGIALLYGLSGTTNLKGIANALEGGAVNNTLIGLAALALLITGFGFKIAAVPFHMWTPDVYQGAPTPITAFMATGIKAAGFFVLARVLFIALAGLQIDWQGLLWIISALTMTVGNIIAISQRNVKRMLAYSSIAHAGYILVGLVAANEPARGSILFYLLTYTFMNIGAFAVVAVVDRREGEHQELDDYAGLAIRQPLLSIVMAVFVFSLAGIPPTGGFMAKLYIFGAAVKEGYIWLVVIAVLNSLISVYYYLRVTVYMFMQEPKAAVEAPPIAKGAFALLLITSLATIYLGIMPGWPLELARQAGNSLLSLLP